MTAIPKAVGEDVKYGWGNTQLLSNSDSTDSTLFAIKNSKCSNVF